MMELADDPLARSYRRGVDGQPEHRCCRCQQCLPATQQQFGADAKLRLQAMCRPCVSAYRREPLAAAKPAPAAPPPASRDEVAAEPACRPHLPAVLDVDTERTCRCCDATLPLSPECWPQRADGSYSPICLDCHAALRQRATRRLCAALREEVPRV